MSAMYAEIPSIRGVARIMKVSQGTVKRALEMDAEPVAEREWRLSCDGRQIQSVILPRASEGLHDRPWTPSVRLSRSLRLLRPGVYRRQRQGRFRGSGRFRWPAPLRGLQLPVLSGEDHLAGAPLTVMANSAPDLFDLVQAWVLDDHDDRDVS